jgi:DNA replication and repair protein RecF
VGVVLVTGENGAGKTNLLEALHVGTQGFSPRTRSDAQLVRFTRDAARIELSGSKRATPVQIRLDLSLVQGKRATLNGARLPAAEQLRRETHTLVFTPDRLAIVKGGPAARRAYFDRVLARLSPARAQLPADYAAAVGQRNAALRRAAAGLSTHDAIVPWSEQVVQLGQELVSVRLETLEQLEPLVGARADELGLRGMALSYEGESPSLADLELRLERDLDRGTTGLGPHLHDVALRSSDRDLRSFGSQGEQRVAVLALLLGEAELLASRFGLPPLLLLDDVLSELDSGRRAALVRLLPEGQTMITATTREALSAEPVQLLEVTPGKATQR